jgi:glycosyltransferase involved in cell wall biosynthesis
VTTTLEAPPRVRMELGSTSDWFAATLRAAATLLARTGRIRLVEAGADAELVHTVGDMAGPAPAGTHHVHTVDRVALGRGLRAARWWVRQERRATADSTVWLAHGRTAARVLVSAKLTAGERVHCLPVLPPPEGAQASDHNRAELRRALGIAPGVRLVLGSEPADGWVGSGDWTAAVRKFGWSDVAIALCAPHGAATGPRLADLLTAADLFVAAGHDLAACNPGAAAIAVGLPVVAVTTDSVADLIDAGRTGYVVPPDADSIAAAVRAHLDGVVPASRRDPVGPDDRRVTGRLARDLLAAYDRALASPPARTRRAW